MLIIKNLSHEFSKCQRDIQEVAEIEAVIQSQDAWSYQTLNDLLKQESIRLMIVINTVNSDVVGYCLYQVVFEQAEILRIGTHPNYQRQGIASQLFIALNNGLQADKVEQLLLEVRADNASAIALYKQQGFILIHRRKGYYPQPHQPAIDALIMQLSYD